MTEPASSFHLASASGGLPSAVGWAQLLMRDRIRPGDIVVDATAGNGHDTLFLAGLVGEAGHVYAVDVQEAAVKETRRRLAEAGIEEGRASVVCAGHEGLRQIVWQEHHGRVKGVMF
ncbi:MAG TPA: methyltransferase domain-containing protein, partial [Prosthecobacter sp.]|nr:methyltransferase domain-containing protein [Prosthecobacter sp.]